MILVARARRFITKVHVKQTLGLILIKMLRQRDLGSQDAASLGEHALLTGGQPMLVDITLGEVLTAGVAYYLSDTAGGICPVADLGAGEYPCLIGIANSTTVLRLGFNYSGVSL